LVASARGRGPAGIPPTFQVVRPVPQHAASKTVTVTTGTVRGLAIEDPQMTIPANHRACGDPAAAERVRRQRGDQLQRVTGVSVAVVRLAR